MIRNILLGLITIIFANGLFAEPGGTYTLTGNEKGLSEIIKADMAAHPNLYKGENYNSYLKKFKSENKIGKRKLKPGDQLQFPETLTSLKHKKNEGALDVQDKPTIVIYIRERMDGGGGYF